MTFRTGAFGIGAAVALAFLMLGALAASLLGLSPVERWILRGVMLVLGLVAGFIVYRVAAARSAAASAEKKPDEISEALEEAERRLTASKVEGKRGIPQLPAVLVMGPGGAAKTTSVARSGLDLELLSGEVFQGDTVIPTPWTNVWYARGSMVVEAAGRLLQDEARWSGLARRLRPSRLGAALTGRPQAPRQAVVCVSCEELIRPGAAESLPAAAQLLRARLQELAQRFGVRLPVYVLFTKADRLPFFADYVRNLTDAEAGQALGVALPVPPARAGGAYADTMSDALSRTFDAVIDSLSRKRLQQLSRETREDVKAGIYEFPRELAKLPPLAVRFMVELCRPSQLAVSPFLRGYYFTGVRAVQRGEAARGPAPQPMAGAPVGATMVFDAAASAQAQPVSATGGRKVPQWLFLEPFFRKVVLRDDVARAVTSGGHGVNLVRRGMLAAAAGLALLLSMGMTTSFAGNRALARDAAEALEGVRTVTPLQAGLPTLGELRDLETLRLELARVQEYERNRRPMRLRWGLYSGDALRSSLHRAYFDRFDRLLGGEARAALNGYLRRVPAAPGETSDYDEPYDALKAHLVTTSHPEMSGGDFLGPTLLAHWLKGRSPDQEITDLAAAQFAFYGDELAHGNPYAIRADEAVVERVRGYLSGFQGTERLYRALIADASRQVPAIQFNEARPGSAAVLRTAHAVPGAFTVQGWAVIQRSLDDVETLFAREEWVTGAASVGQADIGRIEEALRARYIAGYIEQWQRFLEGVAVAGFGGAADAASKLTVLASNESLLLQAFRLAAEQTAVDSVAVAPAFQPLHQVTPPTITDRYISDANKGYMDALAQLSVAMDAVAKSSGPMRQDALSQATSAISQGRSATRQLAQAFPISGAAQATGSRIQEIMQAPLQRAEALVGFLPAAETNAHGRRFCGVWSPIAAKFPFSPSSGRDATIDELNAALKPGESALASLYNDALRDLVVPQGSGYAARVGASPHPTASFLRFFNRLNAVSGGFYRSDGSGPAFGFALRLEPTPALPEITASIDGQNHTFTRSRPAQRTFQWEGARAQNAVIRGVIDGQPVTLVEAPAGTWALFRLLQQARWRQLGGNRYGLEWTIRGRQITLEGELLLTSAAPILDTGYLAQLNCVSTVAN